MAILPLNITALNPLHTCSQWLRVTVLTCLLTFSCTASASNTAILLLHDGENELVQDIIKSLTENLTNKSIQIEILDTSTQPLPDDITLKNYLSLVTLGTQATQITLERNPPVSIVGLLVSKQSWLLIHQQKSSHPRSVIVLDQPVYRQIELMREIYGHTSHIGVLLGPYSAALQTELLEYARQQQQPVSVKTIRNDEELIPALNNLVEQVDVILAEPDPVVYNKRSIQGILLLTYRNKTPVVGFSQAYSRAGAMVSLYSAAENIARQAAEIIIDKPGSDRIYFPKYFSISYNQQVARALGYTLPNEDELIEHIHQKERLRQ